MVLQKKISFVMSRLSVNLAPDHHITMSKSFSKWDYNSLQTLKNFAKSFHVCLMQRDVTKGADKENWYKNQELHLLLIISYLLMTFMCDSGVTLWGETAGQRVQLLHVHMRKVCKFVSQIQ